MSRYSQNNIIKNSEGKRYFRNHMYPEIPIHPDDLYMETSNWDRLETLAEYFYGKSEDYWIIACANPDIIDFGSIYVPKGVQLRIPFEVEKIKSEYIKINS